MTRIEKMRKDGYSKIIKGNGGYRAYLKDMQPPGGGRPFQVLCKR